MKPKRRRHFEDYVLLTGNRQAMELTEELLAPYEKPCSGALMDYQYRLMKRLGADPGSFNCALASALSLGIYQCNPEFPVWVLDEETATTLMNSALPMKQFAEVPALPHPGMYVELPFGLFNIHNEEIGNHRVEWFYLFEDWRPPDPGRSSWDRAWVVIGVGESIGLRAVANGELDRDDALTYFGISTTKPLDYLKDIEHRNQETNTRLCALAVNLIYCWMTKHTRLRQLVRPQKPKSPKKLKRAERRRASFHPYRYVELFARPPVTRKASGAPKRVIQKRVGYWTHYWVRNPGKEDDKSLATRNHPRTGNELHKVARYVLPLNRSNSASANVRKVRI